jgi:holo-[acyl-carrier protein] synthase
MIYGIGIDTIEVARIEKQLTGSERFKTRIFTPGEIEYCEAKKNKAQNYAARFAAKEAFFKALGTGWRGGLAFTQVEVRNDALGKPEIRLSGKARELTETNGITNIQVSLTHLKDVASAIVTLETP